MKNVLFILTCFFLIGQIDCFAGKPSKLSRSGTKFFGSLIKTKFSTPNTDSCTYCIDTKYDSMKIDSICKYGCRGILIEPKIFNYIVKRDLIQVIQLNASDNNAPNNIFNIDPIKTEAQIQFTNFIRKGKEFYNRTDIGRESSNPIDFYTDKGKISDTISDVMAVFKGAVKYKFSNSLYDLIQEKDVKGELSIDLAASIFYKNNIGVFGNNFLATKTRNKLCQQVSELEYKKRAYAIYKTHKDNNANLIRILDSMRLLVILETSETIEINRLTLRNKIIRDSILLQHDTTTIRNLIIANQNEIERLAKKDKKKDREKIDSLKKINSLIIDSVIIALDSGIIKNVTSDNKAEITRLDNGRGSIDSETRKRIKDSLILKYKKEKDDLVAANNKIDSTINELDLNNLQGRINALQLNDDLWTAKKLMWFDLGGNLKQNIIKYRTESGTLDTATNITKYDTTTHSLPSFRGSFVFKLHYIKYHFNNASGTNPKNRSFYFNWKLALGYEDYFQINKLAYDSSFTIINKAKDVRFFNINTGFFTQVNVGFISLNFSAEYNFAETHKKAFYNNDVVHKLVLNPAVAYTKVDKDGNSRVSFKIGYTAVFSNSKSNKFTFNNTLSVVDFNTTIPLFKYKKSK
jgi:hypothetical protein